MSLRTAILGPLVVVVTALGTGLALPSPAGADPLGLCTLERLPQEYFAAHPRLERVNFRDGPQVLVLKPSGYDTSGKRYPVVYLLHGGLSSADSWLLHFDLYEFTTNQPVILVMLDDGAIGGWSDWRDGSQARETFDIRTVIPYIDSHYRTLRSRSRRAIAGFSGGGFGVMHYAARHPHLFAAAAALSGVVNISSQEGEAVITGATTVAVNCGRTTSAFGLFGDPATQEVWWRDHNPTDLASNLGELRSLRLTSGNGQPCPESAQRDLQRLATSPLTNLESSVRSMTEDFDAALTKAGIRHTTILRPCGIHDWPYFQQDFHDWWPTVMAALGQRGGGPPGSFDYRTADSPARTVGLSATSVWGWRVIPDPRRAPEFLDIRDASRSGLTLTGSGTQTVTTAGYFKRLRRVDVIGAGPQSVRPDRAGRITFMVDLGPPHPDQQYTAEARLAGEGGQGYLRSRTVRFDPHARLLLGLTKGMRRARRGRPFRIRVRALGGRLRGTRIVVRDARGRRVGRSRRFAVGERRKRVRVRVAHRLGPGRYRIAAAGRDAGARRVRAIRRLRLARRR